MKTGALNNLTNIRNFFSLLCFEQNATKEEVHNFLQELLKYTFAKNNINIKDYIVTYHFIKEEDKFEKTKKHEKKADQENRLFSNHTKAMMITDTINSEKFDVYFPAEFASVKVWKEENHIKQKQEKSCTHNIEDKLFEKTTLRVENVEMYLEFIFSVLHEYVHIIQYIKTPNKMRRIDDVFEAMQYSQYAIQIYMPNSKRKRLILKTLNKYNDAQGYISPCEQDADKKAYNYFHSILVDLIKNETNSELNDFLCYTMQFLENTKNRLMFNYSLFEQFNAEAIDKLGELNFEEELNALENLIV